MAALDVIRQTDLDCERPSTPYKSVGCHGDPNFPFTVLRGCRTWAREFHRFFPEMNHQKPPLGHGRKFRKKICEKNSNVNSLSLGYNQI